MVRYRLPVPSLLCLFGALLMLTLQLIMIMGTGEGPPEVVVTEAWVKKAFAFAVEQYNQNRQDSANYFRKLSYVEEHSQGILPVEYHFMAELVKTRCPKSPGKVKKYSRIRICRPLEGYPERPICYFKVISRNPPNDMELAATACVKNQPGPTRNP